MHCGSKTNALDGVSHNPYDSRYDALVCNRRDSGDQCDRCRWDNSGDANSNDPNISDVLCNDKDATNLANTPNSMENASTPMKVPKTNHKSLDDRYIQAL